MKKRIIRLAAAFICVLTLASCGQNIAEEAAKKGRAYFDSGDYETAAKAFSLAVENGNTDEETDRLYDITLKFYQANKAYEKRDFATCIEILEKLDGSYVNYGIRDKVTTLKSDAEKSIEAQNLLTEVSDCLTSGNYDAAEAAANRVEVGYLSPEQTDRLNEYKISIAAHRDAEAQKQEEEQKTEQERKAAPKKEENTKTTEKSNKTTNTTYKKPAANQNNTAKNQTAAPENKAPAINVDVAADAYIYPTDTTLLTKDMLSGLSREDTALIRNEIYARKGHIFTKDRYIQYFSNKAWYHATAAVSWAELSETERQNIKLLKEYEAGL